MRTVFLLAMIIALLSFSSCKKDSANPSLQLTDKVKTYVEEGTLAYSGPVYDSFMLSYDAYSRLTGLRSQVYPIRSIIYQYNSATEFTTILTGDDSVKLFAVATLNDSMVDNILEYSEGDTTIERFTYNANKEPVLENDYTYTKASGDSLYKSTYFYYDASGNLVKDSSDDGEVDTYTYYNTLVIPSEFAIEPYSSKRSINLPKTRVYSGYAGDITYTFNYTFDSKNRLSSETQISTLGDNITKRYYY